jgi:hypothetical protein
VGVGGSASTFADNDNDKVRKSINEKNWGPSYGFQDQLDEEEHDIRATSLRQTTPK